MLLFGRFSGGFCITAPAQSHATPSAVYPALFSTMASCKLSMSAAFSASPFSCSIRVVNESSFGLVVVPVLLSHSSRTVFSVNCFDRLSVKSFFFIDATSHH